MPSGLRSEPEPLGRNSQDVATTTLHRNPLVTVDTIIEIDDGIVMIHRSNPPHGWALPGGFVDYGESLETAARRETREETSLDIVLIEQFHTYSAPDRDPRHHTVTTVFIARSRGVPRASDDAKSAGIFPIDNLPSPIVFDHRRIIDDYSRYKTGEKKQSIFLFVE